MANGNDPFGARATLDTPSGALTFYRLERLKELGIVDTDRLPFSIRVLLENALRHSDGGAADEDDVREVASWSPAKRPDAEFPYMPGRVVLQDFTGVPAVVDLASMRDKVAEAGGDPSIINPIVRSDLVVDHSVQVDFFNTEGALAMNIEREYERNRERYMLLKWAQQAFSNFKVVPPGAGIVHQVNLEYLSPSVLTKEGPDGVTYAYPDTCIGTDSHTTMINGLGVLGWGVGGIEAEAVMLGQPYHMLVPEVVGVRLTGELAEGATATDLVLTVTEMLRREGVVEKFVEFFGPGLENLPVADRATISNMSPEYGATCGIFPVDHQTLRYLRLTNRPEEADRAEAYFKAQGMFHTADSPEAEYTTTLHLDLGDVEPSLAGPRRPQDRLRLRDVAENFYESFPAGRRPGGGIESPFRHEVKVQVDSTETEIGDAAVAIAAITSCTNTSNPSVMVGAGLLARNAVQKGLQRKPWVKSSLAPGSQVVTKYLDTLGLSEDLEELGFYTVGYGCTTCIGNSGPLPQPIAEAIEDNDLTVAAVLSGNRNFEGRIHPQVKANYLASPMLVVAYALAGRVDVDLATDPLGKDADGNPVYMKDIWPSQREIAEAIAQAVTPEEFAEGYSTVFEGEEKWKELPVPEGERFDWDPGSTYVQRVPFFDNMGVEPEPIQDIRGALTLMRLGDSVTTDHISPAGSIPPSSPAGQFLIGSDVPRREFNSYGSRRGNHNVMVRGTFGNIRLRNQLSPGKEGDWTIHLPDGEEMRVFDAAMKYQEEGVPLIVIAGKEYGTGSSRDWAAKGPALLGVRATIAESYERIHRSNLVGMGVLPLQFLPGENAETLGISGRERFDITGIADGLEPRKHLHVTATSDDGKTTEFEALARVDTPVDLQYYRHGGVLNYVLRQMMKGEA